MSSLTHNLNKNNANLFLCLAGGGSVLLQDIMCEGCSSYFYGATVAYNRDVFVDNFGSVDKFVSKTASILMAKKAVENFKEESKHNIGVGITATMSYTGQREDRLNRFFITVIGEKTITREVIFDNTLDRNTQEVVLSSLAQVIINSYFNSDIYAKQECLDKFTQDISGRIKTKYHPIIRAGLLFYSKEGWFISGDKCE